MQVILMCPHSGTIKVFIMNGYSEQVCFYARLVKSTITFTTRQEIIQVISHFPTSY